MQNAAGTHCTDMATGLEVEPVWISTVFPDRPGASTCPELMTEENGRCVDILGSQNSGATSPQLLYDSNYGAWYYLYSDGSWAWY